MHKLAVQPTPAVDPNSKENKEIMKFAAIMRALDILVIESQSFKA